MTKKKTVLLDFSEPNSLSELAPFVGISELLFHSGIEKGIQDYSEGIYDNETNEAVGEITMRAGPFYHQHKIPKKASTSHDFREVWQVSQPLKNAYKSLNRRLDFYFRERLGTFPHSAAYGYVKGKNILENASVHSGAKTIVHADIENFFPSITKQRVKESLLGVSIKEKSADLLSEFLTVDDILALGLNTSPMIANLICFDMDVAFDKLAKKYECNYTRYADDITISGDNEVPHKAEIIKILEEFDFSLAELKFRISKIGQSHYVTGLSVSDPTKPRIPRPIKRELLQHLYYMEKYGLDEHLEKTGISWSARQYEINRFDGMVRYVRHIEKEALPDLSARWSEVLTKAQSQPSYVSHSNILDYRRVEIFIDESELEWNGKTFLAICMVASEESRKLAQITDNTLRKHVADPFSDADKEKLAKKGLHFVDATEDLRSSYIRELMVFPVQAYLSFCEISQDNYEEKYHELVASLLRNRLMYYNKAKLRFIFEENSKIKLPKLEEQIELEFNNLKSKENRCPSSVATEMGSKKKHPPFSAPDFFLAVFGRYAMLIQDEKAKKHDRKEFQFEALRDKMRLILNNDNGIIYSRKNQFRGFNSSL